MLWAGAFVDYEGREEVGLSEELDGRAWQRLLATGTIHLGGTGRAASPTVSIPAYLFYNKSNYPNHFLLQEIEINSNYLHLIFYYN